MHPFAYALTLAFGATYTRYADDLTSSSDEPTARLAAIVASVVRDEGFALRPHKTLHRCALRGPAAAVIDGQAELRAHLLGQIACVSASFP